MILPRGRGHCAKSQQPMISAAIRGIFTAGSGREARERLAEVLERLEPTAPKVAQLLLDAKGDLLSFYALPREHWTELRSTNPLERVTREIGRRTDGIFHAPSQVSRLNTDVHGCIEMMSGAVWVRDRFTECGWTIEIADARKVKAIAPLAC